MLFNFLNIGGIVASTIGAAGPIVNTLLQAVFDVARWYLKTFWNGLQVIFSNLSTLTVIALLVGLGGWYFRTWDNPKIIKQERARCELLLKKQPTTKAPPSKNSNIKSKEEEWRPWPWWMSQK